MKKFFALSISLPLGCSLFSCSGKSDNLTSISSQTIQEETKVKVYDFTNLKACSSSDFNFKVDTKIFSTLRFTIFLEDHLAINEELNNHFTFTYNEESFDIFSLESNRENELSFYLVTMDIFDNEKLEIDILNNHYEISISSKNKEYNFNSLTEEILQNEYKEFKEMIDSIKYFDFSSSSFLGRDPNGSYSSGPLKQHTYVHHFYNEYDTTYLNYVNDSFYYPEVVDIPMENISHFSMQIHINDLSNIVEGGNSSTMENFSISYGVIDPDCTFPTNPLYSLSYITVPKFYQSASSSINEDNAKKLHDQYYLLSKKYPDWFYLYQVGEISISLVETSKGNLNGFFEDDNYVYFLSCFYNQEKEI